MDAYAEQIEVCFITTTQYDLLITDIYARYLYDFYNIYSTVFYRRFENFDLAKFNTDGKYRIIPYTINNKSFIGKCFFALQCGYLFPFSSWRKAIDKNKRILLFVFTDASKLSYRMIEQVKHYNSKNLVYLIDEGTDTYSDSLELSNELLWKLKHLISKVVFGCGRTSKVIGDNKLIDGAIVREPVRYSQLKKAKNQKVIQQDTNILESSYDFINHYSIQEGIDLDCDILYLGQPYYRNGKYYLPEELCIEKILSVLPQNCKVLIKPHPRDSVGKYNQILNKHSNVSIVSKDLSPIPIETLLNMTKCKAVVCIQSTAAITIANMLPNIVSVVLREIPESEDFFDQLKTTGEELPNFDPKLFVSKYNNIVCPQSLDEFVNIVSKIGVSDFSCKITKDNDKKRYSEIDELITELASQDR